MPEAAVAAGAGDGHRPPLEPAPAPDVAVRAGLTRNAAGQLSRTFGDDVVTDGGSGPGVVPPD